MCIYIKKLSSDAYIPKRIDNYYELYLQENLVIQPGSFKTVNMGFEIRVPLSYYVLIVPNESAFSRNISIPTFSSNNCDQEAKELLFNVYNGGKMSAEYKKGDSIARMLLIEVTIRDVKEVKDFDEIPSIKNSTKVPRTGKVWFEHLYKNNTAEAKKIIQDIKESEKIIPGLEKFIAGDKDKLGNNLDAQFNYIWENLPEAAQQKINELFNEHRNAILDQ